MQLQLPITMVDSLGIFSHLTRVCPCEPAKGALCKAGHLVIVQIITIQYIKHSIENMGDIHFFHAQRVRNVQKSNYCFAMLQSGMKEFLPGWMLKSTPADNLFRENVIRPITGVLAERQVPDMMPYDLFPCMKLRRGMHEVIDGAIVGEAPLHPRIL